MAEELVYNSIHTGVEIDEGISKTQQIVNPNLLDNWYFVNPVNQRGQTTYTGLAYSIDRWRVQYGTTLTVSDGFVTLSGTWNVWEEFENVLAAQKITLSALVRNRKGTNAFSVFYRPPSGGELAVTTYSGNDSEWVLVSGTVYTSNCKGFGFGFSGAADNFIEILAAKLEPGSQQTLAHKDASGNWMLNEIPNYGEELLKCIQSTADPADTYANKVIATTGQLCNPNLINNWYFGNPVNQRGLTTYEGNVWAIDNWRIQSSAGSLTINPGSVTMSATNLDVGYKLLQQPIENGARFTGMTMTLSVLVSACSGASDAFFGSGGTSANRVYIPNISSVGLHSVTGSLSVDIADFAVGFRKQTASGTLASLDIVAIKLEIGSQQTLAHQDENGNWALNEIPNYHEELLKCIQSTGSANDTYANKVIYNTGNITAGTTDLNAGTSALATGSIYQVYE